MHPKNRPPRALSLTQQVKQPKQLAHQFKPVVAQLKTARSAQSQKRPAAPPAYRPLQAPRVLQTKHSADQTRQVGQMPGQPVNARVTTRMTFMRPVAPPVYRPQPMPLVLQRKSAASSSPLRPSAVQAKAVTQLARSAEMHMPAAATRARVVQMSEDQKAKTAAWKEMVRQKQEAKAVAKAEAKAAAKAAPVAAKGMERKKITKSNLEDDDYLYVRAAAVKGNPFSEKPFDTEAKFKVYILKKGDVDEVTASYIDDVLMKPSANRNDKICAVHQNLQRRLPDYKWVPRDRQPNLEYFVKKLGSTRIVVDVAGRMVYLSYHYGDQSAGHDEIPEEFVTDEISAFVQLDFGSWNLSTILLDARQWWDGSFPGHTPGHSSEHSSR